MNVAETKLSMFFKVISALYMICGIVAAFFAAYYIFLILDTLPWCSRHFYLLAETAIDIGCSVFFSLAGKWGFQGINLKKCKALSIIILCMLLLSGIMFLVVFHAFTFNIVGIILTILYLVGANQSIRAQ